MCFLFLIKHFRNQYRWQNILLNKVISTQIDILSLKKYIFGFIDLCMRSLIKQLVLFYLLKEPTI